jgi:hypothetical protein
MAAERNPDHEALVLRLRGRVYNRHLLKSCGHVATDAIAEDRGKPWEAIVRIVLQEAGVIDMPNLPEPFAIVDADGLKTLERVEKEKKAAARVAATAPEAVIEDPF